VDLVKKERVRELDVAGALRTLKRLVAGLEGLRSLHMLVPGTHGLVFDIQGEAYSSALVCAGLGCGVRGVGGGIVWGCAHR